MTFETLASKGEKIDIHLLLYTSELEVIDTIAAHYQCSRAAVVGKMALNFKDQLDTLGDPSDASTRTRRRG